MKLRLNAGYALFRGPSAGADADAWQAGGVYRANVKPAIAPGDVFEPSEEEMHIWSVRNLFHKFTPIDDQAKRMYEREGIIPRAAPTPVTGIAASQERREIIGVKYK